MISVSPWNVDSIRFKVLLGWNKALRGELVVAEGA